MSSIFLKLFCP